MRAIFEELEEDIARLIPDDGSNPIEVSKRILPSEAVLGDVFEIYYESDQRDRIKKICLIPNERMNLLKKVKSKREALLKRMKEKE
jgi:hypothetical protein